MTMNLAEFLKRYTSGDDAARVVYDGEIERLPNGQSPFIIIRSGDKVMVINPMALEDHISLDVHAFIDGEPAGMGMFGMTPGRRHQLDTDLPATSHGWPAVALATVVLGSQAEGPEPAPAGRRLGGAGPQSQAHVDLAVLDYQREVLADMDEQTIPTTVRSIEDLNDHVDANGYAGFTTTRSHWSTDDLIRVQEIIDPWLAAGYPNPDAL